jgi:hypothetical protein
MTMRRAPIPAFAPKSAAAQVYSALWAELMASVWSGRSETKSKDISPEQ